MKSQGTSKAGEMDWDSAVAMTAGKGSMLQWIQTEVWEYMDTPKLKRDGVDLAKRIYDEVANQAIELERERIAQELGEIRRDAKAEYYNDLTAEDREHVVLEEVEHDVNKYNAVLYQAIKVITNNHEDHKE